MQDGATVAGYDPMAGPEACRLLPDLVLADDRNEAATGAHCVVIVTEWPEFRDLDLVRLRTVMAMPAMVDGRNLLDAPTAVAAGFLYSSMGRPSGEPEGVR